MNDDRTSELQEQVRAAAADGRPLALVGNGTKAFLGRTAVGEPLALGGHRGILTYQPTELVITARAGTPLAEIESALAEHGQMLSFEPPHFADPARGPDATLGGTIACGLSGPARASAGAARDLVLGARILSGRAEVLRFGGEVMKNVAGYDLSRLMVGAMGTLGVLLDVSLKVLPIPPVSRTLVQACDTATALARMLDWAARPLPVSATCFDGERLWVRLSGAGQGVREAAERIGGDLVADDLAAGFWREQVREQRADFFAGDLPLWRLSVPAAAPALGLSGPQWIEWGGALRWLRSAEPPGHIRAAAAAVGGQATLFRGGDRGGEVMHPLPAALQQLQRRLKSAFDPRGILNPGRLYPDW